MIDRLQKKWFLIIPATLIIAVVTVGCLSGPAPATTSGQAGSVTPAGTITPERDLFPDKAYPEYAKGYSVEYHGTYKVVRIHDPWGRASENRTYLLVRSGEDVPDGYPDARVFSIPIRSAITLSVTQIPYLSALNETDAIRGNSGNNLVLDDAFRARAAQGCITEIGSGTMSMNGQLMTEKMIELEPDIVFYEANGNPEYDNQQKLVEVGLEPAIDGGWMEDSPLARAEWIKYYALFFDKEKEADATFSRIVGNYTTIRKKAAGATHRPTIFSGFVYQGTYYAPGGGSYVAQVFRDAGGDYLFSNETGGGDVPLNFEVVYERAHNADFLINIGMTGGAEDLLAQDSRYARFDAVKRGAVYHFDARMNEYGALDYWQSGPLRPDIVLADLTKILHPDLLPDHELYYYRQVVNRSAGGTP